MSDVASAVVYLDSVSVTKFYADRVNDITVAIAMSTVKPTG